MNVTDETRKTKVCRRCGDPKPLDRWHFSPDLRNRDRFASYCKLCRAKYARTKNRSDAEHSHKKHAIATGGICSTYNGETYMFGVPESIYNAGDPDQQAELRAKYYALHPNEEPII